jgi:hypothetical protein
MITGRGEQGGQHVGGGGEEGARLLRRPRRDAQVTGEPDVPDEDTPPEQGLPRGALVGEPAEQDEVRVARHRGRAERGELGDDPVALLDDRPDRRQQHGLVPQRRPPRGLE